MKKSSINFPRRSTNRSRARGIGLMITLIATAFVGITILITGHLFAAQMRRTRDLPHANQHRQLLLAAGDALLTRLNASQKPEPAFALKLPAELADATVTCTPDAAPDSYTIAASSHGFTTRQTVAVERQNGRYHLTSAALSADLH